MRLLCVGELEEVAYVYARPEVLTREFASLLRELVIPQPPS